MGTLRYVSFFLFFFFCSFFASFFNVQALIAASSRLVQLQAGHLAGGWLYCRSRY